MWTIVRSGLDPKDKLVLKRVRNFVSSKQNLRITKQLAVLETESQYVINNHKLALWK